MATILQRVIGQAPKAAVIKQVRSLATPAAETAFNSAPGTLPSGVGAARSEIGKASSTTRSSGRVNCNNYFQVRQATGKPEPKETKKPIRQGVMQNLFF